MVGEELVWHRVQLETADLNSLLYLIWVKAPKWSYGIAFSFEWITLTSETQVAECDESGCKRWGNGLLSNVAFAPRRSFHFVT